MRCGIDCEAVDQLLDFEVLQFLKMVGILPRDLKAVGAAAANR
jgi:hypothetical protein